MFSMDWIVLRIVQDFFTIISEKIIFMQDSTIVVVDGRGWTKKARDKFFTDCRVTGRTTRRAFG